MKKCKLCGIKFGYVEFVNHKCYTVKEWKKLCKTVNSAELIGNDLQYRNFFTQELESYETLTTAEILLTRHKVYLRDHINRTKVGGWVKIPIKERLKSGLKSIPSKMTQANMDKGFKAFDKGIDDFSKSMDAMTSGLGGDKSNKKNLDKLWGPKKKTNSNVDKIWDKPKTIKKKKPKKKSKSEKWDQDEKNLEKIWGKKK